MRKDLKIKARQMIKDTAFREPEIREATAAYPGMEIGAAYQKWKSARGESADLLLSHKDGPLKDAIKKELARLRERPCSRPGCTGAQVLEAVCAGCIEGQAGYKTKWTCRTCLHRDLSKETIDQWMQRLSSV